eukprot:3909502-Pyramimonas_sp.AAC.1
MDGSLKAGTRFSGSNHSQGRRRPNVIGTIPPSPREVGPGTRSSLPSTTSSSPTASLNGVFSQYDVLFLSKVEGGHSPKTAQIALCTWNARAPLVEDSRFSEGSCFRGEREGDCARRFR